MSTTVEAAELMHERATIRSGPNDEPLEVRLPRLHAYLVAAFARRAIRALLRESRKVIE